MKKSQRMRQSDSDSDSDESDSADDGMISYYGMKNQTDDSDSDQSESETENKGYVKSPAPEIIFDDDDEDDDSDDDDNESDGDEDDADNDTSASDDDNDDASVDDDDDDDDNDDDDVSDPEETIPTTLKQKNTGKNVTMGNSNTHKAGGKRTSESSFGSDRKRQKNQSEKVLKNRNSSDNDSGSDSDTTLSQRTSQSMPSGGDKKKRSEQRIRNSSSDEEDEMAAAAFEGDTTQTPEHDEDEEMMASIRAELSTMPFAELQKLKETLGLKKFNRVISKKPGGAGGKIEFKRENKNRPREVTSKKPVARHREVVTVKKKVHRDPRFDDLSGEYNEKLFKASYSFLDDYKEKEKKELLKQHRREQDPEEKNKIGYLLSRMNQQERAAKEKDQRAEREKNIKKQEETLVKDGKTPFYLKKSEKKKLELAEKFKELKKSGKLEKYLMKKRKKNAAKERKKLPSSQRPWQD